MKIGRASMARKPVKDRSAGPEDDIKIIATNRKARHEYQILDTFEAGIVLLGPEVKSLRAGRVSLAEAYAQIQNEEAFLLQAHISPYDQANRFNTDPRRTRKLLFHKKEIRRLMGKTEEKGLTLIPLRIYFRGGKAKVEIALARGKKLYDKRQSLARKDAQREMDRVRSRKFD
jgi:SsrA-binding protein